MERGIQKTNSYRVALHGFKEALEIRALHRKKLGERLLARFGIVGEDHLLHDRQPVFGEEHVLGAAEADALSAELASHLCIARDVGIGAHTQGAYFIDPIHERAKIAAHFRVLCRILTEDYAARTAIDRDVITHLYSIFPDRELLCLEVNLDGLAASHA